MQTFGTIWGTMVASQPTVLGSVMLKFRPFPAFLTLAVAAVVAPVIGLQGAGAQEAPALAEVGTTTTTTLTGPARYADTESPLDVAVTPADATVVRDGSPVVVERRVGGTWQVIDTPGTVAGHATTPATLSRDASDNVFRATYAGDATYAPSSSDPVPVPLKVRGSKIGLGGPDEVVDEKSVTLRVHWRTASGIPVRAGSTSTAARGKKWVKYTSGTTGGDGRHDVQADAAHRLALAGPRPGQGLGRQRDQPQPRRRQPAAGRSGAAAEGRPEPADQAAQAARGVGDGPNAAISHDARPASGTR